MHLVRRPCHSVHHEIDRREGRDVADSYSNQDASLLNLVEPDDVMLLASTWHGKRALT